MDVDRPQQPSLRPASRGDDAGRAGWAGGPTADLGGYGAAAGAAPFAESLPDRPELPALELPRGGGAVRGLAEALSTSSTGSAHLTVPLGEPPGRHGFGPRLALGYSSVAGNGAFGLGWGLGLGAVTLRTEQGVPLYEDDDEVLLGAECLVRVRDAAGAVVSSTRTVHGTDYEVTPFRPRVERAHARIERWRNPADPGNVRWRVLSGGNVTTWYGRDAESRIADPADPRRISGWLPSLAHDDRGNACRYRYRAEDSTGVDVAAVHEAGRTAAGRSAHRYLARVDYANQTPYRPVLTAAGTPAPEPTDWLFHLVVDYGDHDDDAPSTDPDRDWPVRPDPFSSHRTGFEVRLYRRCRRILVFHAFPELGPAPTLVSSTALTYEGPGSGLSLLTSVTRTGHGPDGGTASLPALTMTYAPWQPATAAGTVELGELAGAPIGLDGRAYEWVDLDGDGAPGICQRTPDQGWFYKRNLGPLSRLEGATGARPRFAAPVALTEIPVGHPTGGAGGLPAAWSSFADVDGDGRADLLVSTGPLAGVATRSGAGWRPPVPFDGTPTGGVGAAIGSTLADLTGDGLPDLVVTDGLEARWHRGLGVGGFAPALPIRAAAERNEPVLLLTDADRAVVLADLDGDGLVDLVEVTRTSLRYRPSLGHGRFAPWVVTAAPVLDGADTFDPRRVLFADVDGDGLADLVYLVADGARLHANRQGNGWSPAVPLTGAPGTDRLEQAALVDLFGCGTAALVWSSAVPRPDDRPMRFLDLAPGGKPYLLRGYDNGMGLSVELDYTPSTAYALADDLAGRPWPTRLPLPVHCMSRTVTRDGPRGSTFTSRVSYHLGHYDGVEREFLGFGRVDRRDTEEHLAAGDLPPVLLRRWFCTGAGLATGPAVLHVDREAYAAVDGPVLAEPDLPAGLDAASARHALRAFAGAEVRSEVYAEDGTPAASVPHLITERTLDLRLLQPAAPRTGSRRAEPPVFQVLPASEMSYAGERDPTDPRVTQQVVLDTDDLGCVTRSATVAHPRRIADPALPAEVTAAQLRPLVACQTAAYTGDVLGDDVRRLRAAFRTEGHELTGLPVTAGVAVTAADLRAALAAATEHDPGEHGLDPVPAGLRRRLLARSEARFLADDLATELPAGQRRAHGLLARTHRLVLTAPMAAAAFGAEVGDPDLVAAGYRHLDGDDRWWLPSGRAHYPPDAADHFLLPDRVEDALGTVSTIERSCDLLVTAVTDARGHRSEAAYDLRVLQPDLVTDACGNRAAARFDPLGAVRAAALMGKAGAGEGDTLDDPTTRFDHDLDRWRSAGLPPVVRSFDRERHGPANPGWQESRTFLDGSGAVLGVKVQAPPGVAGHVDPVTGVVSQVDTTPELRWIGTGRTVLDNKGLPIRAYEPYYSDTDEFDTAAALVEAGVSELVHYDPLGRVRRVDHPDGTFDTVETTAWRTVASDAIDTVLDSTWFAERGSPDPAGPEPADPAVRAAWLAARCAGTPAVAHVDPLGRAMLRLADNGGGDVRGTRVDADLSVLFARVVDTRGREVLRTTTDLLGRVLVTDCAERGRSVTLVDVLGQLRIRVDGGGRRLACGYDDLQRPVRMLTREVPGGPDRLTQWVRYGDDLPGAAARNAIGKAVTVFDESGRVDVDVDGFNFTGAPTALHRRLVPPTAGAPDWTAVAAAADPDAAAAPLLDPETWSTSSEQDALGRPLLVTLPDGTQLRPAFDAGSQLATLDVRVSGTGADVRVLTGQEHDAAGRVLRRSLGNGLHADFAYDPLTRRLAGLTTGPDGGPALQQLGFTDDPLGHLTDVADAAQQTRFFANAVVTPDRRFAYDALYQLVSAEGRELAALGMPAAGSDAPVQPLPHVNDTAAVRRYREEYTYDDLGNLTDVQHLAGGAGGTAWRRRYRYAHETDPADRTNRLLATSMPGDPDGVLSGALGHDPLGNVTSMPHLATIEWDELGRIRGADLGGGGSVDYRYGAGGARTRKVVDRGGLVVETLYLGGVEIVRERVGGVLRAERRTVHVPGDGGRIAQVDRETVRAGAPVAEPAVVRYVHGDVRGSAALVTDEQGRPVDYEEYHPYGTTAYRSSAPGEDQSLKRYRFLDRERDEETGFSHLGARVYAPWLGRWISPDPAGYVDGLNLYRYARNDPANVSDPTGTDGESEYQKYALPADADTAQEVSDYLHSKGFEFTGPVKEVSPGLWDVGTWTKIPGGDGSGGAGAEGGDTGTDASGGGKGSGDTGGGPGGSGAGGAGSGGPGTQGGKDGGGAVGDTGGGEGSGQTGEGDQSAGGTQDGLGTAGSAAAQAAPGAEKFIWGYDFPGTGKPGTQRGRILEWLMGMRWRDNGAGIDRIRGSVGEQIKTTQDYANIGTTIREGLKKAERARAALPASRGVTGTQILLGLRTDAPAGTEARVAATHARVTKPASALPTRTFRGLPGPTGAVGRGLTGLGGALAGYAFVDDVRSGDAPMAVGDGLSTVGGGLEVYAIASGGGTVAGVSAVSAGLVLGGAGIAVASGVSAYRSFQRGDTFGGVLGVAGVAAGLAIMAGVIFGAPLFLAAGLIGAAVLGLVHLGRWLFG